MSELLSDLRYGVRSLRSTPLLAAAVIGTLALGIGATAAIFTVVNATLLAPLPYPDAERLVLIWEILPDGRRMTVAPDNYLDWRRQSESFADLAAFNVAAATLTGDGDPVRVEASVVTANFFDVLGVPAQLGTTSLPDDPAQLDGLVLISDGLWRSRYGADPDIVGRRLTLSGSSRVVAGVLPASYRHPEPSAVDGAQVFLPFGLSAPDRGSRYLRTLGRIAADAGREAAAREIEAIAARLAGEYPETNEGHGARMVSLRDELIGTSRGALLLLLGAAALVLLIVCTNVANLLLARAQQRRREMAIRAAMGAGRGRLIRQVLIESSLLTLAGTAAGITVVALFSGVLGAVQQRLFPSLPTVVIDGTVVGFAVATGALTAVLFGIIPALELSRVHLSAAMSAESARGGSDASARRRRGALVVAEVALATVLLIGTGLMTRSFLQLQSMPTGFATQSTMTFRIALPSSRYADAAAALRFWDELQARLEGLSGVIEADLFSDLPFTSENRWTEYLALPATAVTEAQAPQVEYHTVGPRTFAVLGMPLLEGRSFEPGDDANAPPVAVVNRAMAERVWPEGSALGRQLQIGTTPGATPATVVGVVGDTRDDGFHEVPAPRLYLSHRQRPSRSMAVVLRTNGEPGAVVPMLRGEIAALDAELPITDVQTLEQLLAGTVATRRLSVSLLNAFTALSVLLASLGIYGVMAYSVARRAREIAIRGALGAGRGDILGMVVRESMTLTAVGIGLGMGGGLLLGRGLRALLFGIVAADPVTFVAAPLLLAAVALAASVLPACRAAGTDPMRALRRV